MFVEGHRAGGAVERWQFREQGHVVAGEAEFAVDLRTRRVIERQVQFELELAIARRVRRLGDVGRPLLDRAGSHEAQEALHRAAGAAVDQQVTVVTHVVDTPAHVAQGYALDTRHARALRQERHAAAFEHHHAFDVREFGPCRAGLLPACAVGAGFVWCDLVVHVAHRHFHAEVASLGQRRMEREVSEVALDQKLDVVRFAADQRARQIVAGGWQRERHVARDTVGLGALEFACQIGHAGVAVASLAPGAAHRAGGIGVGELDTIGTDHELVTLVRPAHFAAQRVERQAWILEHTREDQGAAGSVDPRHALLVVEVEAARELAEAGRAGAREAVRIHGRHGGLAIHGNVAQCALHVVVLGARGT